MICSTVPTKVNYGITQCYDDHLYRIIPESDIAGVQYMKYRAVAAETGQTYKFLVPKCC